VITAPNMGLQAGTQLQCTGVVALRLRTRTGLWVVEVLRITCVALISIVGRDSASGEPGTVTVMTRNIYRAGTSSVRYARRWTVRVCSTRVMRTIGCRPAPIRRRHSLRGWGIPMATDLRSRSVCSPARPAATSSDKAPQDACPLPRTAPMSGAVFHLINMAPGSNDTAPATTS
jgi:hypothetical protein